MQKKYWNIISVCLLIFISALLIYSVNMPFTKKVIIEDTTSDSFSLSLEEGEDKTNLIEQDLKIRSISTDSFIFYSPIDSSDIELWVTIKKKDEIIYRNLFTSINKVHNFIYLPEYLKKGDSVKISFELAHAKKDVLIKKNDKEKFKIEEIDNQPTYRPTLWLLVLFAVNLIILLFLNKENCKNEKMKKGIFFVLYFLLNAIFTFVSFYSIYKANFKGGLQIFDLSILIFLISTICYLFINLFDSKSYGRIFLLIAIPLSFFYCALCMPEDSPDEFKHYARIYQLASGDFTVSSKVEIPSIIVADWDGHGNVKNLFTTMLKKADYNNVQVVTKVALYHPFCYAISTPVIFLSKSMNLNPYIGWYLAKIANMIFFLLMGYLIVKKMPKYKMLTILYLAMPMNLYQMGSLSCDVMATISTLYLIAHMLNLNVNKQQFRIRDFVIFSLFGFISVVSKVVYFPIVLGLLILNYKNVLNRNKKRNILYLILSLIFIIVLFWEWERIQIPSIITPSPEGILANSLTPIYALKHPFATIGVLLNYLVSLPDQYLLDFVGYKFIWSRVSVPVAYASFYLILMIGSCLIRDDKENYPIPLRWLFGLTALITSGLVVVAMYVLEFRSNMLANTLWGVQGRYFIPIFILFFICIGKIGYKGKIEKYNSTLLGLAFFIHVLYIVQLINFVLD